MGTLPRVSYGNMQTCVFRCSTWQGGGRENYSVYCILYCQLACLVAERVRGGGGVLVGLGAHPQNYQ